MEKLFEANKATDPLSVRNMAIFELLYATGIRVSELISIELRHIDSSYRGRPCNGKRKKRAVCSIWETLRLLQ